MLTCSCERHAFVTTISREYQSLLEFTTIQSIDGPRMSKSLNLMPRWQRSRLHAGRSSRIRWISRADVHRGPRRQRALLFLPVGRQGNMNWSAPTYHCLDVILDKCGVGSDRLQRARHNPLRLAPPRRREVVFLRAPTPLVKGGSAHTTIPALGPTRFEPHHSPASGTGRTRQGRVPG